MSFKFENLKVWIIASELSNEIDLLTLEFPARERYSLGTQLRKVLIQLHLILQKARQGRRMRNLNVSELFNTLRD